MNGRNQGKPFPIERGSAWAITLLLTVLMTVTIVCVLIVQMMTSVGLHMSIATGDDAVNAQISYIHEKIDEMAEEYGFDAKTVKKAVSADEIRSFNAEVAAWWSALLIQGKMKDAPSWYSSEIEESLYNAIQKNNPEENPQTIAEDLTSMIQNTLFPLRESLMSKGMSIAQEKVDIPSLIRTLQRIPVLGMTTCLLAAGLIALLLGREFFRVLKHYGTALAGTGLTITAAVLIFIFLRPGDILAEASVPFADGFSMIAGRFGMNAGLTVAILLISGYLCLIVYNRIKGRNDAAELAE